MYPENCIQTMPSSQKSMPYLHLPVSLLYSIQFHSFYIVRKTVTLINCGKITGKVPCLLKIAFKLCHLPRNKFLICTFPYLCSILFSYSLSKLCVKLSHKLQLNDQQHHTPALPSNHQCQCSDLCYRSDTPFNYSVQASFFFSQVLSVNDR